MPNKLPCSQRRRTRAPSFPQYPRLIRRHFVPSGICTTKPRCRPGLMSPACIDSTAPGAERLERSQTIHKHRLLARGGRSGPRDSSYPGPHHLFLSVTSRLCDPAQTPAQTPAFLRQLRTIRRRLSHAVPHRGNLLMLRHARVWRKAQKHAPPNESVLD